MCLHHCIRMLGTHEGVHRGIGDIEGAVDITFQSKLPPDVHRTTLASHWRAVASSSKGHNETHSKHLCPRDIMRSSRKPAIKNPSRHQWHFCVPTYCGEKPPKNPLPPFAPLAAKLKDYFAIYIKHKPNAFKSGRKYKRGWMKTVRVTHYNWRKRWELKHADLEKKRKRALRHEERKKREAAWAAWQNGAQAEV